jgi:hypothetical protein
LRRARLHDLRHTAASLLLAGGRDSLSAAKGASDLGFCDPDGNGLVFMEDADQDEQR